ncbi:MAG: HEAT repeat domain-containing protein, partial [bacterium]
GGQKAAAILTQTLDEKSGVVRRAAVAALGQAGEAEALPRLKPLLKDDDAGVRCAAVDAVSTLGGRDSAPLLEPLAAGKDETTRRCALGALARAAPDRAWPYVEKALADKDPDVRRAAVAALGNVGADRAMAPLKKALASDDAALRRAAVDALGRLGGEGAVALLRARLGDEQGDVRAAAVRALGRAGGEDAVDALEPVLHGPDTALRAAAADALGTAGGDRAFRLLNRASLEEADAGVRRQAITALPGAGKGKAARRLAMLAHVDDGTRRVALPLLGRVAGDEAVDLVAPFCDRYRWRRTGNVALGACGGPRAVRQLGEKLEAALKTEPRLGRYKVVPVIAGLAESGSEAALEHLEKAVRFPDAYTAKWAVRAAVRIGGDRAVRVLETAFGHKDAAVREEVADEAKKLGGRRVLPLLERAVADDEAGVRKKAAVSAAVVGGPGALAVLRRAAGDENPAVAREAVKHLADAPVCCEEAVSILAAVLADERPDLRSGAARTLAKIGGAKARDALLDRLRKEADGRVKKTLHDVLRESFGADPRVREALKPRDEGSR